jgi:C4-dicarboxylate-specific signal transduction histidine kinase
MAKWAEIKCPMCAELEARIEELTELCALEYQRAWLLETQKNIAEEKLAQQDDLVQAAVAAALRRRSIASAAVTAIRGAPAILALIREGGE